MVLPLATVMEKTRRKVMVMEWVVREFLQRLEQEYLWMPVFDLFSCRR